MYYPDLVFDSHDRHTAGPIIRVGWLELPSYTKGRVPISFLKKLNAYYQEITEYACLLKRGYHTNELGYKDPEGKQFYQDRIPDLITEYPLGNGEFRVKYKGVYHAAPTMVFEYIIENGYLPPAEFIEAVRFGDVIKKKDGWDPFTGKNEKWDKQLFHPKEQINAIIESFMASKPDNPQGSRTHILESGLEKFPYNHHLLLHLANELVDEKKGEEALKVIAKGLEVMPSSLYFFTLKGMALFEEGKLDQAHDILLITLPSFKHAGNTNYSKVLDLLGQIELKRNNRVKADAYFREAQET